MLADIGTDIDSDGLMGGNQDTYDLVNMGSYIVGGMALEARMMYPPVVSKAGSNTVRVGQWMSESEYKNFVKTGEIPRTNVLRKGSDGYYKQANIGDFYVEFDIDETLLMEKDSELGWWLIKSKNSAQLKLAEMKGISLPEPIGTNIEYIFIKERH